MDKSDVLHKLIDVVAGRQAHLPAAEADELHEAITPGYTAVAPSEDAVAQAQAVLEAHLAAQAAKTPALVAAETS